MELFIESVDAPKTHPYIYVEPNPLEDILSSEPYVQPPVSTFGNISGTNKWMGGVLGSNGKIYGAPYTKSTILEIDVTMRTMIEKAVAGISNGGSYSGGCLLPDGKIIFIPCNGKVACEYNPSTNTVVKFGDCTSVLENFHGGVLAPNGKIYCIPYKATFILEIDPVAKTFLKIGTFSGDSQWAGCVLHPNGKIYGIPYNSTQVLEFDPETKTSRLIGSQLSTSLGKYWGGVLAPNGKIYGIPFNASVFLEIDPENELVTTFGTCAGTMKFIGGCLASNGRIYTAPNNAASIEIDPVTHNTKVITATGAPKCAGAVMHPNGNAYCIPLSSTSVVELQTQAPPMDPAVCLSPLFNKF